MIPEQDIDQALRLPWLTICRLAVQARIAGLSMNDVMEQALNEFVWGEKWMTLEDIADLASALGRRARIELIPRSALMSNDWRK